MNRHFSLGLALMFTLTTSCLADPMLIMKGSDTVGEFLAPALAKAFLISKFSYASHDCYHKTHREPGKAYLVIDVMCEKSVSGSRSIKSIRIEPWGSRTALDCISEPQCDIAMSSATITDLIETYAKTGNPEADRGLKSRLEAVDAQQIAFDGISIIVNRFNNINDISTETLRRYFCHKDRADWGSDPPASDETRIERIARTEESGTRLTLARLLKCENIYADKEVSGNIEVSAQVSMQPGAIGFVGFPYIGLTKPLSIDKSAPNIENLAASYPLRRELFLFTKRPKKNEVLSFLQFLETDAGQDAVVSSGFAPIPASAPPAATAPIPEVNGYTPMLALEYDKDGAELNERQRVQLAQIAERIRTPTASVRILGYADGTGPRGYNQRVSELRAAKVEGYLKGRGVKCESSCSWGLGNFFFNSNVADPKARKVEIWVRQ